MQGNPSRRAFLQAILGVGLGLAVPGCGTIFYPERRGQAAGPLDWKVVALDGLGLLFFFIPGVIAFAVDFSNGTIYLPPEECSRNGAATTPDGLVTVPLTQTRPTLLDVEETVSRETSREIRLEAGRYRSQTMRDVTEFNTLRKAQEMSPATES